MPLSQFLLEAKTDLGEHIYQKAMAKCAEIQVLGVIAGILDGPTEEYRKAIAETAGSYLSNLLARSKRTAWWENTSPLDAAATALGYWHKGLAEAADAAGYDDIAKQWDTTGETFLNTDPEKFFFNASSDFITSIGEDCKKRWDVFWHDFREKGLLVAYGKLQVDGAFLAAELAIDVVLAAATGGVMLGVKIVARRVSAVASRVVVRVLHQAGKAIPDSGKVLEFDLPDADINDDIIRHVLDEDKLGVGSKSDDAASRAKEKPPAVEEPKGGGKNGKSGQQKKEDVWKDGSYRNPDDPEGMRRASDGEAMIKNKHGDWKPVSDLRSDHEVKIDDARAAAGLKRNQGNRHNNWKGQWGETLADRDARDRGWEKVNGDDTQITGDNFKGRGIDGIYKNPSPPPDYFVTDAKALGSQLRNSQLTRKWIKNHLNTMVKNGEISEDLMEDVLSDHAAVVQRIDKNGHVTLENKDKIPFRKK